MSKSERTFSNSILACNLFKINMRIDFLSKYGQIHITTDL